MPLISFSKESLDVVVAQLELLVLQGDVLVCPGDCDDYSPSGHRDYELDHHGDHDDYDPGSHRDYDDHSDNGDFGLGEHGGHGSETSFHTTHNGMDCRFEVGRDRRSQ